MRLGDVIDFNPTEKLEKNTYAKKIGMDKLSLFYKYIDSFEYEKYSGGTKFRNGDTIVARITPCGVRIDIRTRKFTHCDII